jgi:predicted transcriptional regulator
MQSNVIQYEKMSPFTQIMNSFLEENDCKNSMEILVFIALEKFKGANGECNPSYKTLANICKCSKTTIVESLKHLEDINYIVVKNITEGKLRKPNVYWLIEFDKFTGKIDFDSLKSYKPVTRIRTKRPKKKSVNK